MNKYSQDYIDFLLLFDDLPALHEKICEHGMLMVTGHINLRQVFDFLDLDTRYFSKRMERHFKRLGIERDLVDVVMDRCIKGYLLDDDIALNIVSSTLENKLIMGRGINDIRDMFTFNSSGLISSKVWRSMFERCYSKAWQKRKPWYKRFYVCKEWHFYSNFHEWFDDRYVDGYHLNKNVLCGRSNVYSPETCLLLPENIHQLISNHPRSHGELSEGVRLVKRNGTPYVASHKIEGKRKTIGSYKTEQEAALAYKKAKAKHIREVSELALGEGAIDKNTFRYLKKYTL